MRYPRPYYAFRPHLWLGFGLYLGFPVPYPIVYGYPTYVYGYPAYAPGVAPPQPPPPNIYGGLSFDVTPPDTAVTVDGTYVGVADDFSPQNQPLTLTAGRHHIELQPPDGAPLAFDVDIVAGEVLPYRGALETP